MTIHPDHVTLHFHDSTLARPYNGTLTITYKVNNNNKISDSEYEVQARRPQLKKDIPLEEVQHHALQQDFGLEKLTYKEEEDLEVI